MKEFLTKMKDLISQPIPVDENFVNTASDAIKVYISRVPQYAKELNQEWQLDLLFSLFG